MKLPDRAAFTPLDSRQVHHLAGWLDLLGTAVKETAPRARRWHLQIADTVFSQVERLAPTQPAVYATRALHHLVVDLSYGSVSYGGAGLSYLARLHFEPVIPSLGPTLESDR